MTYHAFETASPQTVAPPAGFGAPPYGAAVFPPPSGAGTWVGTGPVTPPSNGNANKHYWIIIVGVAALAVVAAVVSAVALKPGHTPHSASNSTNSGASGSAGSTQQPSTQQPSTQQPSTQQPSTQQPATDSGSASQQYLYDLNSQGGDFLAVSDSDLLTYGNAVCTDFEAGNSVQQTVNDAVNAASSNPDGLTQDDLATIIAAATTTLCPSYGPEVQAWANANS